MTELEMVQRAINGDYTSFNQLYESANRKMRSVALGMLKYQKDEVEDILQHAWGRIWRKLHTFKGDAQFSTWACRITVNEVLMHMRKDRRSVQTTSFEELATAAGMNSKQGPDEGREWDIGANDEWLESTTLRVTLLNELGRMTPKRLEILRLHLIDGYEHQEVAAILNFSIGNSKSEVWKGRKRLREALGRAGFKNKHVHKEQYAHRRGKGKAAGA